MKFGSSFASVLGVAASVLALAAPAAANQISFLYRGAGSGTIDGHAFTNAKFVFEAVGDTDDRTSFGGGFSIFHTAAVIEIEGVGTFNLITGTRTFVNNSHDVLGLSRQSGSDLYNLAAGEDIEWDMLHSFELSGTGALLQWAKTDVLTSGGVLVFDDLNDILAEFRAVVDSADVPEPAALGLFGLGLVGLGCMRRRRQA